MTLAAIVAIVGALVWLIARSIKAGADHTALTIQKAQADALKARVEVDHAVQSAASGGASDLAALARASGLVRPGDK